MIQSTRFVCVCVYIHNTHVFVHLLNSPKKKFIYQRCYMFSTTKRWINQRCSTQKRAHEMRRTRVCLYSIWRHGLGKNQYQPFRMEKGLMEDVSKPCQVKSSLLNRLVAEREEKCWLFYFVWWEIWLKY